MVRRFTGAEYMMLGSALLGRLELGVLAVSSASCAGALMRWFLKLRPQSSLRKRLHDKVCASTPSY